MQPGYPHGSDFSSFVGPFASERFLYPLGVYSVQEEFPIFLAAEIHVAAKLRLLKMRMQIVGVAGITPPE